MIISMIAAVAKNRIIGKDNDLVWNLPDDTRYFMDTTKGHHILTGRRNYESIPPKYRPLKDRTNIIVTNQENYDAKGAVVVHNIQKGIDFAEEAGEEELFIIGGGEIYRQALGQTDKLYITEVHGEFEGDTFFPEIEKTNWKEISRERHPRDDCHDYSFDYVILKRKN